MRTRGRISVRRPRWLTRPVAVLIAVLVGLGGLGGAAGMALGGLGAAVSAHDAGDGHGHHHDDGPGRAFGR